jgi:hypothetical protein
MKSVNEISATSEFTLGWPCILEFRALPAGPKFANEREICGVTPCELSRSAQGCLVTTLGKDLPGGIWEVIEITPSLGAASYD